MPIAARRKVGRRFVEPTTGSLRRLVRFIPLAFPVVPGAAVSQTFQPFPSPPTIDASGSKGADGASRYPNGDVGQDGQAGGAVARTLGIPVAGGASSPLVTATSHGRAGGARGAGRPSENS